MAAPRTKSKMLATDFINTVRNAEKLKAQQAECDAKLAASLTKCDSSDVDYGTQAQVPGEYNQITSLQSEISRLQSIIENQEFELLGLYRQVAARNY